MSHRALFSFPSSTVNLILLRHAGAILNATHRATVTILFKNCWLLCQFLGTAYQHDTIRKFFRKTRETIKTYR